MSPARKQSKVWVTHALNFLKSKVFNIHAPNLRKNKVWGILELEVKVFSPIYFSNTYEMGLSFTMQHTRYTTAQPAQCEQPAQSTQLKQRDLYLKQLIAFKDKEPVKVITGIRRCGKSSLLRLMQDYLLSIGVDESHIVAINFESMEFQDMTYKDVYAYVKQRNAAAQKTTLHQARAHIGKMYLFFDELQRVDRWEDMVNSCRVDFDCDIYITGSNAYLLSSEYATYLAGRYVEIKMYPLSFREFIDFHGYELVARESLIRGQHAYSISSNAGHLDLHDLFEAYMRFGGMPAISEMYFEQRNIMTLLDGIYATVVLRDILEREKKRGQRQITDAELLRRIILFLSDNVGNTTSLNTICNTLSAEKLLLSARAGKPSNQTIAAYIGALKESYLFYEVKRFDIKGRDYLRTLGKYYIVDVGLRNYLLGFRDRDRGHILENVVFLELLRRGYDVAVGKINSLEVDFIAQNASEKLYIQVSETMRGDEHRARELRPLECVQDNYEKLVITLDKALDDDYNGIRVVHIIDWLLS